jgi:hypothetical protein
VTNRCRACDMNWWPYQTDKGCCPLCGGGTTRTQEPGSIDADAKHKAEIARRREAERKRKVTERFEKYAAKWDAEAMAAQAEELAGLPVVEPRRAA